MKRISFVIGIAAAVTFSVFASNSKSKLSEPDLGGREYKETQHILSLEDQEVTLVPDGSLASKVKERVFGSISSEMGYSAEKLYEIKKSEISENPVTIEDISKIMRSISKMEGMLYYSHTRKRWDILYKTAHRIDSLESKNELPDDLEGSADGVEFPVVMEDHSFGKNYYDTSYLQTKKEVAMFMRNTTTMAYGPIKAVKPGNFKLVVYAVDKGDTYDVYMAMYADFNKVSMFEKKMNNSFLARLEAVFRWFLLQF